MLSLFAHLSNKSAHQGMGDIHTASGIIESGEGSVSSSKVQLVDTYVIAGSGNATNGGIMTPYHRLKTDPPNR